MKAIHKLTSWIGAVAFATVITMAVPTQSQATWSGSWTSWSKNSTTACDTDKGSKGSKDHKGSQDHKGSKGSKGSSDKGSTCNTDKGSKGSKGSSDKGSTCNTDKGSKGSKGSSDKGSTCNTDKGSKGSKGSSDKGSTCNTDKGSKGSKGSSDKGSTCNTDKGSKGSKGSSDKGSKGSKGSHGSSCHTTGKVCGVVFEDSNDNAEFDKNTDKGLANVSVNIIDSNGDVTTVTTNAKGFYCARGIATGTATVDINDTTLPIGAEQVVGTDPSEVKVRANRRNPAGTDGYTVPTPVGNVCGTVYEDTNDNGTQDVGEIGVADIKISIMDANGETTTVMTDADGKYCATGIVEGSATITVDPTTLPANAQLTAGVNPNDITIVANENNPAGTDGYIVPVTTGTACGTILVDGAAYEGAIINIVDANNETRSATTGADGQYCVADLPLGNATFSVDIGSLPYGVEQVQGENPTTINIEGNPNNDAGIDAYEILYGKTCGVILLDTNENGLFDSDDTGIEGVSVEVTDAEGVVRVRQTDANGLWCVKALSGGEATVDIIEDTLPAGAVQVYGLDPNPVMITAGQYTAGQADGFIINALTCPIGFEKLSMIVFTPGRTSSDNLQTVLPIDITSASAITFVNVHTSNKNTIDQPYEQFMIASVDAQGNLLANTGWTNDINNVTLEDEFTDLGTLSLGSASELLLVHRADPVYGDINSEEGNSVSFKGLCYKLSQP